MEYNKLVSVTGFSALFEMVSSKTDGALVRSLEDSTTRFVSSRVHQFSQLESIEVYTNDENVNLLDVFKAMEADATPLPAEKDNKAVKAYFESVYPSMDFERVYNSDMKKMVRWFGVIKKHNIEIKLSLQMMRQKTQQTIPQQTKHNPPLKPLSMQHIADIQKLEHVFLPEQFSLTSWEIIEPYFVALDNRRIQSAEDLEQWLKDLSELEAFISEDACWRQVRMTCDTENKELEEAFNFFYLEIQPKMQPYADALNKKLIDCPFTASLDRQKYFTYLRSVQKSIDLFREANIPLQAEASVLQQQYGTIAGKMMVEHDGGEFTLQQAAKFLEHESRNVRETVYRKIAVRRLADKEDLDGLYTKLINIRHQMALNAGYNNYRDYKFAEMGRFDYTPAACFQFHDAVKEAVMPLVNQIYRDQQQRLGLDTLKPWDTEAEPAGIKPLRPFIDGEDLLKKSITCLDQLDPFFGDCLRKMEALHHLDLDSRKGKAPGGYNMPLAESGAPFIFMNAAAQMADLTTMVHEAGHAVHSFLAHPLELTGFKEYPTEMAEVASMAMELFTMDHWEVFFDSMEEMKRAKRHQLERVITIFPWIATIDKFQHWIYEHPNHSPEERKLNWLRILGEFSADTIDYSGLEAYRSFSWQRQLHLFEVPFYYIEYGIAQLGAIGMWKQYREDPVKALENYTRALSLGGTQTLPALYQAAGIDFDFSLEHINTLMLFVKKELDSL